MPRQLPWLNKGGATTKSLVKSTSKPVKRTRNDIDDDPEFYDNTALASPRKGEERVGLVDSDDDLPSHYSSRPMTPGRKGRRIQQADELPSSSPPPADASISPPEVEFMQTCVDRFEMRDDEWMMVEDEVLQTAKLYTRHLHLAEYARLKKSMQIKRDVVRPVIPGAKPSEEQELHIKAQNQLKTQKKAIKAMLADVEGDVESYLGPPKRASSSKIPSPSFSRSSSSKSINLSRAVTYPLVKQKDTDSVEETDSDDLDAPPKATQKTRETPSISFAKPTSPIEPRPTPFRRTFDFLDDHESPLNRPSSPTKPSQKLNRSSSPAKSLAPSASTPQASRARPSQRPSRPFDFFDDTDLPNKTVAKEQDDRIAKRKAEREKEKEKAKKKDLSIDDVPTFLF